MIINNIFLHNKNYLFIQVHGVNIFLPYSYYVSVRLHWFVFHIMNVLIWVCVTKFFWKNSNHNRQFDWLIKIQTKQLWLSFDVMFLFFFLKIGIWSGNFATGQGMIMAMIALSALYSFMLYNTGHQEMGLPEFWFKYWEKKIFFRWSKDNNNCIFLKEMMNFIY